MKRSAIHIPWSIWRRLSAAMFLVLLLIGKRGAHGLVDGGLPATTWFGVLPFLDPLAALEVAVASRWVTPTMVFGVLPVLALSLLAGPVFCGWLCPLGLLLDVQSALRTKLARMLHIRSRPQASLPGGHARYVVLGLAVGCSLAVGWPVFQVFSPINMVGRALLYSMWWALLFVGVVLLVDLRWPRFWCRRICPQGGLYALLGARAPMRIHVNRELASQSPCRQCTVHCPMGIRVMEDYTLAGEASVSAIDCIRCGDCADVCPTGVLRMGFTGFFEADHHAEKGPPPGDVVKDSAAPQTPCVSCDSRADCDGAER